MKIISLLILVLFSNKSQSEELNVLCADTNKNPQIYEALYIRDQLLLVIGELNENRQFFAVNGFKYDGNDITFQSIERVTINSTLETLKNVILLFTLYDPEPTATQPGTLKAVAVTYGLVEREQFIRELKGFTFDLSQRFEVENIRPINLNIYKYKPDPNDTIHLSYLFRKFPDSKTNDIQKRMVSIMGFPKGLPDQRLYVYYKEMAERTDVKPGEPNFDFKRHLIVRKKLEGNTYGETDWGHDNTNVECINQNEVDSTFALSEMSSFHNTNITFDLIEFFGNQYFIKRVEITLNRINKILKFIKNGTIAELFRCVETKTTTTSTSPPFVVSKLSTFMSEESITTTTTQKTKDSGGLTISSSVSLLVFLNAVVFIIQIPRLSSIGYRKEEFSQSLRKEADHSTQIGFTTNIKSLVSTEDLYHCITDQN